MFFWDWTYFLLIPAFLFALWAQFRVSSTFKKFSKVGSARNITAAQVANNILKSYGINDVSIEMVRGNLTDHYDPRTKTLRLSNGVGVARRSRRRSLGLVVIT